MFVCNMSNDREYICNAPYFGNNIALFVIENKVLFIAYHTQHTMVII